MKNLIEVELFKFYKRKIFISITLLSSFSLIYALGIYFKWSFILISGKLDLIAFATTMWALIMMLGIPLVLFSFLGATILGGEITDGQILLEITRVYSRKKLIIGKFLSVSLVVLLCYLLNILLSSLFYMLFVANSSHGTGVKLHFMDYSIHLMLESITGVFFLILMVSLSMFFSASWGSFRAVLFTIIVFVILKFVSNIQVISIWLPGYYTLVDNANYSHLTILYQIILMCGLSVLVLYVLNKQMVNKNF
ncbi:putative ABC transporter protein [Melissococcus plutonius]|uniref:ABC-2 family transporter protein n=1 Tax=Melissococcus plutonius (strain ATCC 35311 / DSM 29964 / CIP 104052 / LMG 20360 / NCIMB 702443) TaxID=940190 RepID=F3Y7T1_MELPT|nr:ABC transporter permease subunit [Melissococcus plutonius]AIM25438.1 putative ABC transporter protein [Melissococcus plutonius S1]KMT25718.1 putative ABC transporter protein [Melissococcus plutonius]KMT27063.1 putative ABC transporter protein [Melissococcus plutonius]KMT28439.1 putative ABC transporter protein [Melissococcus plutonius]KMT29901.1 putative ABC transporter protein [Melissococcus plutonius]